MTTACLVAVVAWHLMRRRSRVVEVNHSPAPPAAKKAGKQRSAAAAGLYASIGFHVGIGGQHGLIAFILLPANVPGMMVPNQYRPRRLRLSLPTRLPDVAVHDFGAYRSSAESIGTRIYRIGENVQEIVICRQFPNNRGFASIAGQHGQVNVLLAKPEQRLANAPQFEHLAEDQQYRLLHALVGILFDVATGIPVEAHRQDEPQFAAAGLLADGRLRSLAEQVQFKFRHGALQTQEQTIIDDIRIVDSIKVHYHRSHHATQLDQVMPVPAITRQARCFDAEHGSNFACAHFRHETLKPWTVDQARRGTAQVVVNDTNVLKAQAPR